MPRRNGSEPAHARVAASELRQRAATLRDDAVELGLAGKRLAEGALHQAGDSAQHLYRQGRTRVLELERTLEDTVREYPIRSLLIAFGVGYVFGRMWRR